MSASSETSSVISLRRGCDPVAGGLIRTKLKKPTVAMCEWIAEFPKADAEAGDMAGVVPPQVTALSDFRSRANPPNARLGHYRHGCMACGARFYGDANSFVRREMSSARANACCHARRTAPSSLRRWPNPNGAGRVPLGGCPPSVPTDPYVLALVNSRLVAWSVIQS